MRRPNGTGTVVKLKGNRRKPFAVRVSARDKYGMLKQETIGYYETGRAAQAALDAYNAQVASREAPAPDKLSVTVREVYDLWSARKYAKAGPASVTSYKASWKRLEALSGLKMRDVTLDALQKIIDRDEAGGLSKSSINNDRVLMRALFRFAMERDMITKDYTEYLEMPSVEAKFEKGSFTDMQMRKLEEMASSGFPWADTVLTLCYTGFRVSEFLTLTPFSYDAAGDYLRGGMKTKAGKNRIVPVHPKIKPYLMQWLSTGSDTIISKNGRPISSDQYRSRMFRPVVEALGVPQATPHWCRHTFASRLHTAGAQELEQKRLLGHADKDVTEHYTHTDIEQLSAAIRLLA